MVKSGQRKSIFNMSTKIKNIFMLAIDALHKNVGFWEIEEIPDQQFLPEEAFQIEVVYKRTTHLNTPGSLIR